MEMATKSAKMAAKLRRDIRNTLDPQRTYTESRASESATERLSLDFG